MKIFKAIISLVDISVTGLVMYLAKERLPKKIWLISERANQAQDNGIAFFEYLNRNHPEIESCYILEKDSCNIAKVRQIGKVLIQGSFKHKLYFLRSEVIATTEKNIIEPWGSHLFYKYLGRFFPRKTRVFLQHGIMDKDVSSVYGKVVSSFDLFVTSATRERRFIIERFGYEPEEVINVGLPRYDKLESSSLGKKKEKLILFMPTWRRYLNDLARQDEKYRLAARENFIRSKYYKVLQDLLEDETLKVLLKERGYRLMMVTHHGINAFKDLFNAPSEVEIRSSEEIQISEALKQAEIFITDYSSVHFDSAYLGNINLYYPFDLEEFRKGHAETSYFNYEQDGFGKIAYTKEELLELLDEAMQQKGIRQECYSQRVENFFSYTDHKNCERLYQEITSYHNRFIYKTFDN